MKSFCKSDREKISLETLLDDKKECVWNVFRYDINEHRILMYNIFLHNGFTKEVIRLKDDCLVFEEFSKELLKSIRYFFWGKCEYEFFVSGYMDGDSCNKISIYDQLILNFKVFAHYTWLHCDCINIDAADMEVG